MSEELIDRVTGVIARMQKIPPESVTIDKTFAELKIDSLDGINIMFAVENEFGIDIPDEAASQIRSVREMVEGIEKLLARKKQTAGARMRTAESRSPASACVSAFGDTFGEFWTGMAGGTSARSAR